MNNFFFLLFTCATLIVKAQVPQGINYQAVVRNNSGVVLTSATVNVKFELFNSASSSIAYSETHNGLSTSLVGVITCIIGRGNASVGTFSSTVDWSGGDVWYQVFVDVGTGLNAVGAKQKFSTVPYSFYSHKAENAKRADEVHVTKTGTVLTIGTTTIALNGSASVTPSITGTGGTIVSGTYPTLAINSPTVPNYTAGTGIAISGNVISNTILPQPPSWIKSASTVTLASISDKVGIGTNNPASSLEVVTSGALLDGLRITNTGATVGPTIYLDGQNRDWTITGTNSSSSSGADKLVFRDYSSGANRLVIDGSGNIGIGTSTPIALLHLNAQPSANVALLIDDAHIKIIGTAVTLAASGSIGSFTASTVSLMPLSNDVRGSFSFSLSGSGINPGNSFELGINFSKTYVSVPTVIVSPLVDLQGLDFMISNITLLGFRVRIYRTSNTTILLPATINANSLFRFNYFVIE